MLLPYKVSHAQEALEVPENTLLTGDSDIVVGEEEEERIWALGRKGYAQALGIWVRKSLYLRAEIYYFDS